MRTEKNRGKWPHFARMYEGHDLSDQAAPAIASSILQDVRLIIDIVSFMLLIDISLAKNGNGVQEM